METTQNIVYQIDRSRRKGQINPLLFGHNLEHTRSCVWQGISAQLLRNRKFYGQPQRDGVALEWYAIPATHAYFELISDDTYTEHWNHVQRRLCANEVNAQWIELCAPGGTAGIGQGGIPLHAGWAYEGCVAVKAAESVELRITVQSDDGCLVCDKIIQVAGGNDWREYPFTFSPTDTSLQARIELRIQAVGAVTIGAVSLLPADHFQGMRRDVMALLREIGCTMLRWPGGNFAGDYRWLDGLLPVNKRAPLGAYLHVETLPHSHGYDSHEIGTDEYIALCREINAEPFMTINIAWDTPEDAAAWVEYCNGSTETVWGRKRAERGHPEPYGVKYWSLGNEMGYGHMEGPNTPEAYAEKAAACAAAMRQVDPHLVFVISGHWSNATWQCDALPLLNHVGDCVSYHNYSPHIHRYTGDGADEEFQRVVTSPARFIAEMRDLRARIDAYAPGNTLGISCDEWDVWYAWYRHPGIAEGIHNAMMLHRMCREAASLGLTYACFFEPINEGAILVEPFRAYLPAGGQVFPLLKVHQGNILLEVPVQPAETSIDLTASYNEGEATLVMTLVNFDPRGKRDITISLEQTAVTVIDGIVLTAPDYLPGTDFTPSSLPMTLQDNLLSFSLPQHSVALLRCEM